MVFVVVVVLLLLHPDVNGDGGHRQTSSGQKSSNSFTGRGHGLLSFSLHGTWFHLGLVAFSDPR